MTRLANGDHLGPSKSATSSPAVQGSINGNGTGLLGKSNGGDSRDDALAFKPLKVRVLLFGL